MLNMVEIFAIQNVDERTSQFIVGYAEEHKLSMAEALRELVLIAQEHLAERPKKKYKSIFDSYDEIAFVSGEITIGQDIDKILYGGSQ
jgi:hypothetical protein